MPGISIKTISEKLGLSTATVSRALNHSTSVTPETAERVRQAARELGYVPNAMARGLRTSRLPLVGVMVPDIVNEYFSRIVLNLQLALAKLGYSVFICNTNEDPQLENSYLSSLQTLQISGLICISGYDWEKTVWPDIPTVYIDRMPTACANRCTVITSDNVQGGLMAAKELASCGCRHPIWLGDCRSLSTATGRLEGFRQGLSESGIQLDDSRLLKVDKVDREHAYETVRAAISGGLSFDGLFCGTDWLALGAIEALKEAGIPVPGEVRVVGYDDISAASIGQVPVTTIHQDVDEMSRIAVSELARMLDGKSCRQGQWIVPVSLVHRKST